MFNAIIEELAKQFNLANNASPFLQMVLAFITNRDTGGIAGFLDRFRKAGMSSVVNSWVGSGINAKPISPSQVDSALGNSGLLSALASRFGIDGATVSSALAYALPLLISKLTSGGTIPASLTAEVTSFIGPAGGWLTDLPGASAAGDKAKARGGSAILRWLPWVIGTALLLWIISMCGKQQEAPQVGAPPPAAAPAPAPEPATAPAMPTQPATERKTKN